MKRVYLLFILTLFCTELFSQSRIDDFYSLITSSNVHKKSEIWTFVKTDSEVIKTRKNKNWDFHKSLIIIGKLRENKLTRWILLIISDTIFVFQWFNGVNPYDPFTMIVTENDWVVIEYGSVKHFNDADGWPFYYDYFHPSL